MFKINKILVTSISENDTYVHNIDMKSILEIENTSNDEQDVPRRLNMNPMSDSYTRHQNENTHIVGHAEPRMSSKHLLSDGYSRNKSEKSMHILFKSKRIVLNIGGNKFEIKWSDFDQFPTSRLGKIRNAKTLSKIESLCDEVDLEQNEIYFDRSSTFFNYIIDFYRTGKLHLPDNSCILSVSDELSYWQIDDRYFEQCCYYKYHQAKEDILGEIDTFKNSIKNIQLDESCWGYRNKIWNIMDKPDTSIIAKVNKNEIFLKIN